jgi:hypothetical protein
MTHCKQLENVEFFNYLDIVITNDTRWTCKIKYRISMVKAAFSKKRTFFTIKLNCTLMKKLLHWSFIQ